MIKRPVTFFKFLIFSSSGHLRHAEFYVAPPPLLTQYTTRVFVSLSFSRRWKQCNPQGPTESGIEYWCKKNTTDSTRSSGHAPVPSSQQLFIATSPPDSLSRACRTRARIHVPFSTSPGRTSSSRLIIPFDFGGGSYLMINPCRWILWWAHKWMKLSKRVFFLPFSRRWWWNLIINLPMILYYATYVFEGVIKYM